MVWPPSIPKRVVTIGFASVITGSSRVAECGLVAEPRGRRGVPLGAGGAGSLVGGDVLAGAGQRAVGRDVALEAAGPQVVDERVEGRVGELGEVAVVDLHARGFGARGDALVALDAEEPVVGGLARSDAELLLRVVQELVAAHEVARDRRAHVDDVLAARAKLVEHPAERRRAEHLRRRDAHQLGDVLHGVVGEVAVLFLREVAERDGRRLRDRVAAEDLLGQRLVGVGEPAHLSTSPRMGSTLEMMATPSASRPPCIMCGSVCRFTNDGPRMCMR